MQIMPLLNLNCLRNDALGSKKTTQTKKTSLYDQRISFQFWKAESHYIDMNKITKCDKNYTCCIVCEALADTLERKTTTSMIWAVSYDQPVNICVLTHEHFGFACNLVSSNMFIG